MKNLVLNEKEDKACLPFQKNKDTNESKESTRDDN